MDRDPKDERGALSRYLREVRLLPQLDRDDEIELIRRIERGDAEAADRLVEGHLSFVVKVASEYRSLGVPFEDLLNEGNLGLIEAAKRYDRGKGTRFITYAVWWVRKKILQAIGDHSLVVRVPLSRRKKLLEVREAERRLARSLGRAPDREEIARHLSVGVEDVDRARGLHLRHTSLDQPIGDDDNASLLEFLEDSDASVEQRLLGAEAQVMVARAFGKLSSREQVVLAWRLALGGREPWTLQEIAERLDLSRERVRQIENEAKQRLRRWVLASLRRPPRRRG